LGVQLAAAFQLSLRRAALHPSSGHEHSSFALEV